MKKFKLTKEHEGLEMWCFPTGNNIPRNGRNSDELFECKLLVENIKRIKVDIGYRGYSLQDYGNTEYKAVYENKDNYGYVVFSSLEGLESYKRRLSNEKIINSRFSSYSSSTNLTDGQLARIVSILEE